MSDFLNNLGKKFMDVAGDLEKKTEDTIEIQKIKSQIQTCRS